MTHSGGFNPERTRGSFAKVQCIVTAGCSVQEEAMDMRGRRRSCQSRGRRGNSYTSSSESSSSSESDASSDNVSCGSAASDDLALRHRGKSAQQAKLRRLRRIFLSRPTKKDENNQNCSRPAGGEGDHSARKSTKRAVKSRSHSRTRWKSSATSSTSSSASDDEPIKSSKNANGDPRLTRPLQTAIDQHFHALSEQAKRHSAQRDSTNSQVQSMLERAVDELQFLKQQEERAMESQVKLIQESYTLRLEVFQQQYLAKVAEIEDEMYTAIQQQQEQCDLAILTAAKQLQEQTQLALLKGLPTLSISSLPHAVEEFAQEHLCSSAYSTTCSSMRKPKVSQAAGCLRTHRGSSCASDGKDFQRKSTSRPETSPVSKQRAKLQALEQKLAAFSPGSVDRVRSELSNPRRSKPRSCSVQQSTLQVPEIRSDSAVLDADLQDWQASPLSPLRKGPSYWKNGISLETRDNGAMQRASTRKAAITSSSDDGEASEKTTRKRTPSSLLSRRFLRPEEEEELRHLRTSIGLAKDWMDRNQADRHD